MPAPKALFKLRDATLLIAASAGVFYYFYYLDPRFICQWQKPVFFMEARFFRSFLLRPGGLLEYISAFLTQAFSNRLSGAVILMLIFAATLWISRRLLHSIAPQLSMPIFFIIPAAGIVGMTSLYTHPLAATLAFLSVIIAAGFYFRLKPVTVTCTAVALMMMVILYYLTSAAVLLFVALVLLYELLFQKNGLIVLLPVVAVIMVFTADRFSFVQEDGFAFLHLLPFHHVYRIAFTPHLLYAFFPCTMLLGRLLPALKSAQFDRSPAARIAQAILASGLAIAAAVFSFSRYHHDIQQIDHFAAHRQWRPLIHYMQKHPQNHRLVILQTYRALYHEGRMLDNLHAILPHERAVKCLVMDKEFAMTARLQYSDLLMDFGYVNEAEHWACEALAHYGEAPEVLLRLAQVNILKGNREFAEMCVKRLSQNPFYRREGKRLQEVLSSAQPVLVDSYLQNVHQVMFREDFPQYTYRAAVNLQQWHRHNPTNRMVFEYWVAYFLLSGNQKAFIDCIDKFQAFGYKKLPRSVEEAAILYRMITHNKNPEIGGYTFGQEATKRFADYMQILANHRGNKEAAQKELLKKHGNTYWYYQMFTLRNLIKEKEKESAEELS